MQEGQLAMWRSMEKDPHKTHLMIMASGGKRALWDFTKSMAMKYKLRFTVLPTAPWDVQRWVDLAICVIKEILPWNPSDNPSSPDEQYVSKGKNKPHVRRAYQRMWRGRMIVVKACLVNGFLLEPGTKDAELRMVASYNATVVVIAKRAGMKAYAFPEIR